MVAAIARKRRFRLPRTTQEKEVKMYDRKARTKRLREIWKSLMQYLNEDKVGGAAIEQVRQDSNGGEGRQARSH